MTDITDYLMRQAADADRVADEFIQKADRAEQAGDFDSVKEARNAYERASFYRGQASGFRQATFVVIQYIGTKAHD